MTPPLDSNRFRSLCGFFPTGVAVITAWRADGTPAGMTANSFTSVSLAPPLVSVSIDHLASMHATLLAADEFAVNVLARDQEELSRRFAGAEEDRFADVAWVRSRRGLPVLAGAVATLECRRYDTLPAGDHTIILGEAVDGGHGTGAPLIFFRGAYGGVTSS